MEIIPEDTRDKINSLLSEVPKNKEQPHYTETMTLDQSAKIVTYNEIAAMKRNETDDRLQKMDVGAYAALKGYDAINAEGHGKSGSYTVILNRTKVVMLDARGKNDGFANLDAEGKILFQIGKDGLVYAIRDGQVIGWVCVSEGLNSALAGNQDSCKTKEKNGKLCNNAGKTLDKSAQKGTIKTKDITEDGGPGSGNFGHEGREGKLGGSKAGGGSGSAAEKDHKLGSKASAAAQKIYDAARENEKKITPVLQKISHSVGCELSGLEYSVKTASSVMDKIERKRKSNAEKGVDISDEQIVRDMGDLVRYTQMSKHDDLAGSTRKTIDALQNEGYIVSAVENKYLDEESAYKGIHLDVISPEGQKLEFQIHSEESMEVKNKLHPLYEEYRKVTTLEARKEELQQEMFAISKGLRQPKNIEEIKTRKG